MRSKLLTEGDNITNKNTKNGTSHQGSRLSTTLFLLTINDIIKEFQQLIKADYLVIYTSRKNI